MRYILNTSLFIGISNITDEKILVLVLCEIFYPIMNSKFITDIFNDTYTSIKRGIKSIYYITRLESTIMSLYLSYMSYINYNYIGILTVCITSISPLVFS